MANVTCSECDRKVLARGFCPTHYSYWHRANRKKTKACAWCGDNFETGRAEVKHCSASCGSKYANSLVADSPAWKAWNGKRRANAKPLPTPRTEAELQELWRSQRSKLRASWEDADYPAFFNELKARCKMAGGGCWEWQGRANKRTATSPGYAAIRWGGKSLQLHRMSLEAKHGAPLGTQHSHHTCANTICVNPEHLQPATHAENIAEMKARTSYEARIYELEEALRELAPAHELLTRIQYGEGETA